MLTRKQWFMLVVLVFGSFLTILNQTLITPALPSVMVDMDVDASTVQWLTTGFTLVNAIMIPITAYLQDRFSTKKLFLVSMGLFATGSLLAGIGETFAMLLIGRLVQAGGAGILMPMTMTVLMITFPLEKRGSAMGVFGLVIAFAPAIGPTISGIVIDQTDWHILFFAVTALALLVIVASLFLMQGRPPANKGDAVLDPLSVALSTLGFGLLLYGFSVLGSRGIDAISVVTTLAGVAGVIGFYFRQTRLEHPMLQVKVLKNRRFLIGTVIGMLVQGALMAAAILMPIYVQSLMGYSATVSGLVLMPGALIMGVMNPVAGRLFDKHGPRKMSIVGMVLLTATTFGLALCGLTTAIVWIAVLYAGRMLSMALVNMPITTWAMNALDDNLMNHGTSVNNTLRQVAGSLGTALIISISTVTETVAAESFEMAPVDATMIGIQIAFAACGLLMFVGMVLTIALVKNKVGDEAIADTKGTRKTLLESIMKRDIYSLPETATVKDAMELFISRGISAVPIVNDDGEPVGFISDGDILKRLSRQSGTVIDPIVLITNSVRDESAYDERLEQLMEKNVREVGVPRSIGVSIHSDIADVCRVLAQNHLKKVPVLEDGHIVGIINRSDITLYSMKAYLQGRPDEAVYCEEGSDGDGEEVVASCSIARS